MDCLCDLLGVHFTAAGLLVAEMTQRRTTLLASLLPLLSTAVVSEYELFTQRYTADPAPFVSSDGRLYITTSHDLANATGWSMRDYNCLSTDDLVNWRDEGIVFSMDTVAWADSAWAQQVVQLPNGTYLMAFPGMGRRKPPGCNASWCHWPYPGGVGIASSPSPAGPFIDQLGAPIMPGDDPTLFVDQTSGDVHLCSNLNGPNCGILAADLKSWRIPAPGLATWPSGSQKIPGSDFTKAAWHWYEAPWIYKIGRTFYLSFMMDQKSCLGATANINNVSCPTGACAPLNCSHAHYGSDLGYAVSTVSPVANYSYRGSFFWAPPYNCGLCSLKNESVALCNYTGGDNSHHGMIEFPRNSGKHWLAYHTRKLGAERGEYRGYQRNIGLDRMYVNRTDYSLLSVTATPRWLRPLKYLNPFVRTPAFTIAGASIGIDTEPCTDAETSPGAKALNIAHSYDGAATFIRHVDFGKTGATSIQLRVATPLAGTWIEIRSDTTSNSSRLLAQCQLPHTGGWQKWRTINCVIPAGHAVGIHKTIHFVFRCTSGHSNRHEGLVNFHWWQCFGGQTSGTVPPSVAIPVKIRARGSGGRFLTLTLPVNGSSLLVASSTDGITTFDLIDNEDGTWAIAAISDGDCSMLCVQSSGVVTASHRQVGSRPTCTKFRLQPTLDGSWAICSYMSGTGWLVVGDGQRVVAAAVDPRGQLNDRARFELTEV
eukprot:COSAG01_NODE_1246_length_11073_cov_38.365683_6_plen_710_part_00